MPNLTTSRGQLDLIVAGMTRVQDGVEAVTDRSADHETRLAVIESGGIVAKFAAPALAALIGLVGPLVSYGALGARMDATEEAVKQHIHAGAHAGAAPRIDAIEEDLNSRRGRRWSKPDQVEHERKIDARFERVWNRLQSSGGK